MKQREWQTKLLPFTIISFSSLGLILIVIYVGSIVSIQSEFSKPRQFTESDSLSRIVLSSPGFAKQDQLNYLRWEKLYFLEKSALENRAFEARLIIRTRILTIGLSFIVGLILSLLGAVFIIGRYSEDATEIAGEGEGMKANLKSSSPGIILSFLGCVVIIVSIVIKANLTVQDAAIYISDQEKHLYSQDHDNTDKDQNIDNELDSLLKKKIK